MSVHLCICDWGMLSFITPPVALGAYAAAPIAGARPMETGFEAMRLGSIIYFIPFFFVFDPAFIWQGPLEQTALVVAKAMVGIVFVAGALQGYLLVFGRISDRPIGLISRAALGFGGIALAMPGNDIINMTNGELGLYSAILIAVGAVIAILDRRHQLVADVAGSA